MNTQNNPKVIDFQTLSDAEKAQFIKETRKQLKQRLEDAKFWREITQNDQILADYLPAAFEESQVPDFLQAENENYT